MVNLQQFILNMLLVSIPEEFFITILILILLRKNKFLSKERLKKHIPKILGIVAIPMALISNILKIYIKDANVCLSLSMMIFSILIYLLCENFSLKEYVKVTSFTILGHVAFMLTETITILIVLYVFKLTPEYFNQTAMLNFLITIPERIIQYGFLVFYFLKVNGACQVNIIKAIIENKALTVFTAISTIVDLIILAFILKYCILEDMLQALSMKHQMVTTLILFSLVIFNFIMVWIVAVLIYPQEKYKQKYGEDDDSYY